MGNKRFRKGKSDYYRFFYGRENATHQLGAELLRASGNCIDFSGGKNLLMRRCHISIRGRCCNIIALDLLSPMGYNYDTKA
jgi:hypothetical protein